MQDRDETGNIGGLTQKGEEKDRGREGSRLDCSMKRYVCVGDAEKIVSSERGYGLECPRRSADERTTYYGSLPGPRVIIVIIHKKKKITYYPLHSIVVTISFMFLTLKYIHNKCV